MKPEAWYDANRAFRDPSRSDRDHGLRAGERAERVRPHARLAQPDAGVVLHPRRRHAADERRRRPAGPARAPARAHLRRRPDAEHGVRPVRERDESARRLRRRQRGGVGREHRRRPASQPLVRRPRRVVRRPRLPLRGRGLQRDVRRRPAPAGPSCWRSTTTTPSRRRKRQRLRALVNAPARTRRAGRCRRPPVPPQPLDADSVAGGRDRRVRRPAGDAGRERARRDDGHPGDRGAADRPGLLLPGRLPHLPRARGRALLGDRVGPHRRAQLARRLRGAARVRRRAPGEARLPRDRRRRAAATAAIGLRLHGRGRPRHRRRRVGAPAAARDRGSRGVPVALARGRARRPGPRVGLHARTPPIGSRSSSTTRATWSGATAAATCRRRSRSRPAAGSRAPSCRSPAAAIGELVQFDVRVTDGATTVGWNQQGAMGTLTLVEPLSYTEAAEAPVPPTIDGEIDGVWTLAHRVSTDVAVQGASGATARRQHALARQHHLRPRGGDRRARPT